MYIIFMKTNVFITVSILCKIVQFRCKCFVYHSQDFRLKSAKLLGVFIDFPVHNIYLLIEKILINCRQHGKQLHCFDTFLINLRKLNWIYL